MMNPELAEAEAAAAASWAAWKSNPTPATKAAHFRNVGAAATLRARAAADAKIARALTAGPENPYRRTT